MDRSLVRLGRNLSTAARRRRREFAGDGASTVGSAEVGEGDSSSIGPEDVGAHMESEAPLADLGVVVEQSSSDEGEDGKVQGEEEDSGPTGAVAAPAAATATLSSDPSQLDGADLDNVAIKVFKMTLNEFKNRNDYVEGDFRFRHVNLSRQNPRKIVKVWAEKEMKNLARIHHAGIPCPKPLLLRGHVLVMTFIGSHGKAAPQLKVSGHCPLLAFLIAHLFWLLQEAKLSGDKLRKAYRQMVHIIADLYHKCRLVHADLSEFNVL